jgi:hypothetical protein
MLQCGSILRELGPLFSRIGTWEKAGGLPERNARFPESNAGQLVEVDVEVDVEELW